VSELFAAIDGIGADLGVVVLSAAVETRASVVDCSDEEWRDVIDTNLKGPFLCMKEAVPRMVEAGGGSIVALGSTLGQVVAPKYPAYCASKFGLTNLCKQVAIEHAKDNVRVNIVAPSACDTGLFVRMAEESADPDAIRHMVTSNVPMGRLGRADEVCDAVAFLASDRSSYLSGAVLPLDGGLAARRT
jgi:NAD(P)-dependent dehydrogenase (short-subunit alcohol dehydrogenase family)